MKILYTKENAIINNNLSVILGKSPSQITLRPLNISSTKQDPDMASGDNVRCCRLCSAEANLKFFKETYIWEGVEQRYDQLLTNCFGVTVKPLDCMICDTCIRTLRSTERFRALVHAAFDATTSNSDVVTKVSSSLLIKIPLMTNSCQTNDKVFRHTSPMARNWPQIKKKPVCINKMADDQNDRMISVNVQKFKHSTCPQTRIRKVNVRCYLCQQRYPMVVSSVELQLFVCPRCKKDGEVKVSTCKKNGEVKVSTCKKTLKSNNLTKEHFMMYDKVDPGGKTRHSCLKRKLVPSPTIIFTKQQFQCTRCHNKYDLASQLATHVENAHGVCTSPIFGKCRETLDPRVKGQKLLLSHKDKGNSQYEPSSLLFKKRKALYARKNTSYF